MQSIRPDGAPKGKFAAVVMVSVLLCLLVCAAPIGWRSEPPEARESRTPRVITADPTARPQSMGRARSRVVEPPASEAQPPTPPVPKFAPDEPPSRHDSLACDDIVNLAEVNVPFSTIIAMIENKDLLFTESDLACMTAHGLDADILAHVEGLIEEYGERPDGEPRSFSD